MLTKERKRQLDIDLWIIALVSALVLGIYIMCNNFVNTIVYDSSIPIVLRVLLVGGLFQFGLAGLGITIVCIMRKEHFCSYGLRAKGLALAILLSAVCVLPDFIYNLIAGNVHSWCPFLDVNTTRAVLASGFPSNLLGMLITAVCWGFFEGFNYVVISSKING